MQIGDSPIERGGFLLFLALASAGLIFIAWPFAAPLLWATLAAIIFQPLQQWFLKPLRGPNRAAIASLLVIFFAVLLPALFIGSLVVEEAARVFLAFRSGEIDVAAWFDQILAALPATARETIDMQGFGDLASIQRNAEELLTQSAGLIAQQAVALGGGVFGFALAFGVGLYVTYFLLRDGHAIGEDVLRHLPLSREVAERLSEKFLSIVRATIKGSVVVGIVQGILGAITFTIVGMPSVVLFGVLMGIFSLLPAVGPAIVWLPVAVYLLATGEIWQGVVVLISGVAVIGMADNLLRPILVGRDTGIPDWLVLVTTLGGIAMMGLAGIVIGPMLAGLFIAGWSTLRERNEPISAP